MASLTSYLEEYGLLSLEKQEKLARVVGEHSLELDLDAGLVRFSSGLELSFQILGTESDNTLTWLWAWADEQTEVPADLLRSSLQMKAWGEKEGIPECTMPSVDLNKADGHMLSMIASEICEASCYYQDAYEGGALFLLLFGGAVDRQPSLDADGLARQFSNMISFCEFNHANAFRSYLRRKNLTITEHGTFIVSELDSGEDVRANFDREGRLLTFNGKVLPVT